VAKALAHGVRMEILELLAQADRNVETLAGMIRQLTDNRVPIFQGAETHENGIFAWVIDPDGNKVELWEPKPWKASGE